MPDHPTASPTDADGFDRLQAAGVIGRTAAAEQYRPVFACLADDEVSLLVDLDQRLALALTEAEVEAHGVPTVGGALY